MVRNDGLKLLSSALLSVERRGKKKPSVWGRLVIMFDIQKRYEAFPERSCFFVRFVCFVTFIACECIAENCLCQIPFRLSESFFYIG